MTHSGSPFYTVSQETKGVGIMETLQDLVESFPARGNLPAVSWSAETGETVSPSTDTDSEPGVASLAYHELYHQIINYSRGLLALGAEPGDRVALFCHNRPEWIGLSLGINFASLVDVPRGENSTAEEIEYILDHARPRIIIVENRWFYDVVKKSGYAESGLSPEGPLLVTIEGIDGVSDIAAMRELGRKENRPLPAVTPGTTASIVYTSGTTADPKGVELTHGNFAGNLRALVTRIPLLPEDRLLSILPAWHTFERIAKYLALAMGAETFHTTWRTLKEDLKTRKPTVMASVPRIWEMIHRTLVKQTQKLGIEIGETVYAKLKADLGGRFRFAISGGGALPDHVEDFYTAAGVEVVEGYGLTETTPVVAARVPGTPAPYTVGPLLNNVEGKIIDPDTREELPPGREGVLFVKGPNIMKGYYRLLVETRQVLSEDGWLDTGDLAYFAADGNLSITGRIKEIIVLLNGENINPLPLEEALKKSDHITEAVVVGQDWKHLGVLILSEPEAGPAVPDIFKREINRLVNGRGDVKPFERIKGFRLLTDPFQPGRELTPTMKLKRTVIEKIYEEVIEDLRREIHGEGTQARSH